MFWKKKKKWPYLSEKEKEYLIKEAEKLPKEEQDLPEFNFWKDPQVEVPITTRWILKTDPEIPAYIWTEINFDKYHDRIIAKGVRLAEEPWLNNVEKIKKLSIFLSHSVTKEMKLEAEYNVSVINFIPITYLNYDKDELITFQVEFAKKS